MPTPFLRELLKFSTRRRCLHSLEFGGTERKMRKIRGKGCVVPVERCLVLGRSQQQHSYTYILGRHKQRRRHSRGNSSSISSIEGRRQGYEGVGIQDVVSLIAISKDTAWCLRSQQHSTQQRGRYSCCLLYTSPSPRDGLLSRMPSSA